MRQQDNGIVNMIAHNYHADNATTHEPPAKRMKLESSSQISALPIYLTGDNLNHWSKNTANGKHEQSEESNTVQEQSDFVGLLLEAAELIEKEENMQEPAEHAHLPPCKPPKPGLPPLSIPKQTQVPFIHSGCETPVDLQNPALLLASMRSIMDSTASSLAQPISMEEVGQLSAVLALGAAASSGFGFEYLPNLSLNVSDSDSSPSFGGKTDSRGSPGINISHITDISSVPVPCRQSALSSIVELNARSSHHIPHKHGASDKKTKKSENKNRKRKQRQIMPDIAIAPNIPFIEAKILPISRTNPSVALPKLPPPPSPPPPPSHNTNNHNYSGNATGSGLDALLRVLNAN